MSQAFGGRMHDNIIEQTSGRRECSTGFVFRSIKAGRTKKI